jgi:hypothetical protein
MSEPAAKNGDRVVGLDVHIVMITTPGGQVPTPLPFSFTGSITSELCSTVLIDNEDAATEGSKAENEPEHIAMGGSFQETPSNEATITSGSGTVFADNKALARSQDPATCCNDLGSTDNGNVIASGTVFAGG